MIIGHLYRPAAMYLGRGVPSGRKMADAEGVVAAGGAGGVAPAGRLATAAAPTIPAGARYFDFTIRPGTLYDPFSGVDLCDEKGGAYSGIGGKRGPRRKIPVWRS